MSVNNTLAILAWVLLAASIASAQSEDRPPTKHTIKFYHEDYPPFVFNDNGVVRGTVADKAKDIASRAGFEIHWQEVTFRRLLRAVRFGEAPGCAPGYNKIYADMEEIIASKPISWFRGSVLAIRREDSALFSRFSNVDEVIRDESLRGAFLSDVDYTGVNQGLFSSRHIILSGTDTELARMVARGRVHYAPMSAEQVEYLQTKDDLSNLAVLSIAGMRPPQTVSIICTSRIQQEIMEAINAAIIPVGHTTPN